MKNILIIGADTPIGWNIYNFMERETDHNLIPIISKEDEYYSLNDNVIISKDIFDKKNMKKLIFRNNPDVIINCIFRENSNYDDSIKQQYWSDNVTFMENLTRACVVNDTFLIAFSSEYVFDGAKGPYNSNEIQKPINFMGKTMLAVENLCKSILTKYAIIRLPEYYGYSPYGYGNIADKISAKRDLTLASNHFTNPVFIEDIAITVYKVIEKNITGIINVGGSDYISLSNFGNSLVSYLNLYSDYLIKETNLKFPLNFGLVNTVTETSLSMKFSSLYLGATSLRYLMGINNKA